MRPQSNQAESFPAVESLRKGPAPSEERAVGRYLSSGRLVPPDYILSVGTQPTASFERLKKSPLVSSWARYANDQPRGQPPRLIERSPNSVDVRDPKLRARAAALEEAAERFEKLTTALRTTEQALLDQQRFEVAHIIDRDGKHVARVTSNAPDYVRSSPDLPRRTAGVSAAAAAGRCRPDVGGGCRV